MTDTQPPSRTRLFALTALVFLLALIPRIYPRHYITYDEASFWAMHSENFRAALQTGDLAATVQDFHPGVMTMWVGTVGILIDETLYGADHAVTNNEQYRYNLRVPVAVVNAAAAALAFWYLTKLFSLSTALMASLLWALDIFGVEHGGTLHVDGLSTSFMVLSFLSGLIALGFDKTPYRHSIAHPVNWRWWIVSAAFGGMATLTKFTSVGVIFILAFIVFLLNRRRIRVKTLGRFVWPFVAWGLVALVTIFALYPALWGLHFDVVFAGLGDGVEAAFEGHKNFFMGKPTISPPPTSYLLVYLFRATPFTLIGLILTPIALWDKRHKPYQERIIALLFFVVLYAGVMILQRKQQDRYILQISPTLDILAAFGWLWIAEALSRLIPKSRMARIAGWGVMIALLMGFWFLYRAYPRAYYNPMLGGGRAAIEMIRVGDGEGMDQAAAWIISQHPDDLCEQVIVTPTPNIIRVHFPACVTLINMDEWPTALRDADYALLYISHVQRDYYVYLEEAFAESIVAHPVTIYGIPYVTIYDMRTANPAIDWNRVDETIAAEAESDN